MTEAPTSRSWLRDHRQASVFFLTALTLAATVAAVVVGGIRLHHAVLIERQTLRTTKLGQEVSEYEDAVAQHGSAARRATVLGELRAAFANVRRHGRAEADRLEPAYRVLLAASATDAAAARTTVERRIDAEISRLDEESQSANPGARAALLAAIGFAAVLVALLIWQFELERRAGRIDRDVATRAEELARLREEFVAVVSHELRTPLTSIVGYLELLADDPLTPAQETHLAVVLRSSQRLSELVGDLLLVAEGDRAPLALDVGTVDLTELADQAVEAAKPAAAARRIDLHTQHDGATLVPGDRTRLAQLLDNLVSNALKFTPADGLVTVAVERRDGVALVEVSDTGTGIPAADRDRVFEPFFRSRNAIRQAAPGTGLGLTIAHAIVEAHGGTIEVKDGAGGSGTTFCVRLPAS